MRNENIQLLIENSKELDKLGMFTASNEFRKCNALSLMIKHKKLNYKDIEKAVDIVKKNSSMFSNFRGNNLLTVAVCISLEDDMESSFKEIKNIYESLKNMFTSSPYLVLASIVIYNSRHSADINTSLKNTKTVYESMKKNHKFLTSSEDISAAAMIAVASENVYDSIEEIENCYKALRESGFMASNNLQSLSHILALIDMDAKEKVARVNKMDSCLKNNKISMNSYSFPLLGITIIVDDMEKFALEVKSVSDELKEESGFGNFVLGKTIRNMIAVGVVISYYIENLSDLEKEKLINTTNNINLTIQIAMEMAAVMAATSAAIAASSSNS